METLLAQDGISQKTALSGSSVPSTLEPLAVRAKYRPYGSSVSYSSAEQQVAMNIALSSFSPLSMVSVEERDLRWDTDGSTVVHRHRLGDGTAGYFKPLKDNSICESDFRDYGVSSLGAAINELNAYRMAQLLGGGYAELVPETVLREIDDTVGTLQREVSEPESRNFESEALFEDYRRAALFDFVIGNLDRHDENFLYGLDELGQRRIRLIDNSFSFPGFTRSWFLNQSIFADNSPHWLCDTDYSIPDHELDLTADEFNALCRAREGVAGWLEAKTIGTQRGKATLKRIDFLIEADRLKPISGYLRRFRDY